MRSDERRTATHANFIAHEEGQLSMTSHVSIVVNPQADPNQETGAVATRDICALVVFDVRESV